MTIDTRFSDLEAAAAYLQETFGAKAKPEFGLVLGSGLSSLASHIHEAQVVPYADIPAMPKVSVEGHDGSLVLGTLGRTRVACLSGRVHLYEGHSPTDVVFGVRLLSQLGVKAVLLTNAAGGIAADCAPGTLMLVTDHLNLTGQSPLLGKNDERLGPRFPDLSSVYDPALVDLAATCARELKITLAQGIYAGLTGPSYETPAEIHMLETMGASAVGMSTVLEAIALRHRGTKILGISCITNHAAGKSKNQLSHAEVAEVAGQTSVSFCRLVTLISERLKTVLA